MSVVSVRARSFILALFIRDDGERFLLGDNGYDFMDSQLHFSANTIENDEVEKQGADGTMLAGQVRRASVQTFDGYVGDATTPKEEIEQMRRDFIAFFAKDHHFRVIYVDCNRNAWQRKGGYLVDAPEVKELWQIHPEYHVGLNFEDVNYYEYDENAEGQEILANIMKVPISSDVEGGLVWDENGAVSEPAVIEYDTETASASGTNISISDAVEAPLSDFKLKGETSQNGTPTPSAPVAVQTVTGENVIRISDGQGNEQSYEVNLGKNLFDAANADVKTGYILNNSGVEVSDNTGGYTRNYSVVKPNTTYTISGLVNAGTRRIYYYDGAKNFISRSDGSGASSWQFTTPANCHYVNVQIYTNTDNSTSMASWQIEIGSQATDFAAYFTPIELCKIGTYQDYIYENEGKWYLHKEVGTVALNARVNALSGPVSGPNIASSDGAFFISEGDWNGAGGNYAATIGNAPLVSPNVAKYEAQTLAGNVAANAMTDGTMCHRSGTNDRLYFRFSAYVGKTGDEIHAILASQGGASFYYHLDIPTDTEITNEALVAQLEAILSQGKTYAGTNNITTVISAGNEQGELEITYYTRYDAKVVGGGYVWEAGGSGGPTIVTNESISAVSPVWTVFGPALNPQLENVTTGEQIQYVGMIGEGQTLVIDMGQQTALLDGLNVVANIVGDYLSLAPGSNTLLFSADSDAPESEIGWSEIVG